MEMTVVRYRTTPDRADENAELVARVFAELAATQPAGLRYMTLRLTDGVSFVHVAALDGVDVNPLTESAAFAAFTSAVGDRCEEGPVVSAATVVGAYGFPVSADAAAH